MKTLKKIIALAFVALFAANCNKDQVVPQDTVATLPNFKAFELTSKEIPNITASFQKTVKANQNAKEDRYEQQLFWIDEESSIAVQDSIGNMTYSFRMYVQNSNPNSVYNLVVNRRVDGDNSPDFVMRYEFVNQDPSEYSQMEDKKINGRIDVFSLQSFLSSIGETSKGSGIDPCFDDIGPVRNSTSSNNGSGGNGGSSGNNGGTGYNSGATTTSGSAGWATAGSVGYTGAQSGGGRAKGTVEVGYGCFCATMTPDTKTQKGLTSKGDDCPKGQMMIAINTQGHVHLEDQVNNPCVRDILRKLQQKDLQRLTVPDIGGLSGTGHLSQGILDLFDKSGNYDLTFKIEQLGTSNGNELNGRTVKISGGWEIKLDSDLVHGGTRIFIAKTIIHESTHAFIQYILGSNRTSDLVKDLNKIHRTRNDANLTQHEFMSQYVDALAHSLSIWDNNAQSMEYYKKLSWGGLETSDAYKTQSNKTDIQNTIQNERFNKTGAKGIMCN